MAYDRTLIRIRERSFLDLMDLALLVVRRRPGALALAAAGGIAPFALFNGWISPDLEGDLSVWPVLFFFEAPWATAPLTVVLGGLMFDQSPPARAVLGRIIRASPSLFLVHFLLRGLLGITFILLPLIPGRFWFASEVILLERGGGLKALGRCGQLSMGRSGAFFQMALAQCLLGLVFAVCFWLGTGQVVSIVFKRSLTWEQPALTTWSGLRFQLGVWISIAFLTVARFLIYLDQRIRTEGWELRLRLQAVGRELSEGRS